MAIDLFSETSPRISFSHDLLGQTDFVPINNNNSRSDTSLLDSTSSEDFEFGVSNSHEHESSSADELFSDGVILPIQILKKTATPKQAHPIISLPPRPEPPSSSSSSSCWNSENSKEKPQAKSFWSFKRSSSLNCENGHKRSLLCSLPLLSRSNSTGSVPNPKRTTMSSSSSSKDTLKQNPYKLLPSISMSKSASSSSTTSFYTYPLQQKQTTKKKNYGGSSSLSSSSSSSYGGVRISPVLNVPPPYISKSTANLFGLASFFGNGKDHNNKKNKK